MGHFNTCSWYIDFGFKKVRVSGLMWRERLMSISPRFQLRAGSKDLRRMELALGVELNSELRQLLHVCNGVTVKHDIIVPLWPIEEIVVETLSRRDDPELRQHHMPMTHLVFIGSEGNGDLYALGISATGVMGQSVFLWDHETDGRRWVADSLEGYFKSVAKRLGG